MRYTNRRSYLSFTLPNDDRDRVKISGDAADSPGCPTARHVAIASTILINLIIC